MKAKSRILFPALAALAIIAIAVVVSRRPISTSAQTTGKLPEAPQPAAPVTVAPNGPRAVMDTSMGRITCQFFQKQAPIAVANFIGLATGAKDWTNPVTHQAERHKPLYDGTIFHRVIPEFMIQGGDPTGTGYGDPGFKFGLEVDPNLNFDVPGRLAMAHSAEPNSNGSQFFITEVAYPTLDQQYTIFGQCDDPSVDVVRTIARVPRDPNDKPLTPVVLKKVTIVPEGQPLPPLPAWEQPAPAPAAPAPQQ